MFGALLLTGSLLAQTAAANRPPNGTYIYALSLRGKPIGTSEIVFSTNDSQLVVQERAALSAKGALQVTTDTTLDSATLRELEYIGSSPEQGEFSVSFSDTVATIHTGTVTAPLAAIPGSPLLVLSDGLMSFPALLPAIVHAAGVTHFTLAALNGGKALAASVAVAQGSPPSCVPKRDIGMAVRYAGATATLWYNSKTYVLDELDNSAAGFTARLNGETRSTVTVPVALATAPPSPLPLPAAQYTTSNVYFPAAGGARLAGVVTIPDGAKVPLPTIVMAPGSGPEDRDETIGGNKIFLQLANALSNHGYVVVRYDKRGIGKSTGSNADLLPNAIADITAAFNFTKKLAAVDKQRIYLLGHSEGGSTVPTLATRESGIRGIILLAPMAIPLDRVLLKQETRGLSGKAYAQALAADSAAIFAMEHGTGSSQTAQFVRSWASYSPSATIAQVPCPILILQGTKDIQILPSDLPNLVNAAKRAHRNITVRLLPGDDHLFLHLPGNQKSTGKEYFQPAYIDPALPAAILTWLTSH